ncbi:hybrid sensor histidine kinase/response regulator [Reticulibacter mediterranei]|nr:response regulator [Reticulibacter mediterranei]
MSNTSFDKLSVLDSFIEEVNSYLPEIETNLERLAQSPGDMDALEETSRHTHTIGGAASMMDFPGLAHVAHGMEDILCDALDGLTTLDEPTLGLLQRSLGRLHQLLEGIRNGINEEAVIAEDDADYSRYRASMEASAPSDVQSNTTYQTMMEVPPSYDTSFYPVDTPQGQGIYTSSPVVQPFELSGPPSSSSIPTFDEVLASFRTQPVNPSEDVAWPEESVVPDPFDISIQEPTQPEMRSVQPEASNSLPPVPQPAQFQPQESYSSNTSALEALAASIRKPAPDVVPPPAPSVMPAWETSPTFVEHSPAAFESTPTIYDSNIVPVVPGQTGPETTGEDTLPQVYDDAQKDAQSLETQAASLKNILLQLRSSMSVIETQRAEFKGFLDGSKDALDRMEDWAGKAMGLNLRNSPEQVRRYLPLSVMWVANSKLKKVLDLLNQITGGIELTDEQIAGAIQQLHASIAACGDAFRQMQVQASTHTLQEQNGWTPWDMQLSHDGMHERVTFERHGDLQALRAEIEAQVREELRREYDANSIPAMARIELEQQIRNQVLQEYEAKQRLQGSTTSSMEVPESLQELEARLRNDIEIQVRQEFLTQIMGEGGDASVASRLTSTSGDSPSTVASFVDRTYNASTAAPPTAAGAAPVPMAPLPPPPAPKAGISSTSSFASDFGEEATEIFRLEAEEHLQTIGTHVAALEKAPTNRELIQGIRRATHTLKGAAGMMGFRAIADLSHISEDLLDSIMEGTTAISPAVLSIILDTAETLDVLITGKENNPQTEGARVQALRVRYTELLGEQNTSSLPEDEEDIDLEAEMPATSGTEASAVASSVVGVEGAESNAQRGARGDLNVRVRLQKLDELVNLFGELLVNRSVLEERVQRLVRLVSDVGISSNRLREVGQKLESRFEAATLPSGRSIQVPPGEGDQSLIVANGHKNGQGTAEPAHLSEFDELELDRYTEFHQLTRGLSEGISDMATLSTEMEAVIRECESVFARENRLSTTFQDRLMKVRLVPLSTMTPRLYRAARAVALKQHKEFEFLLEGVETEVDRTVYEEVAAPLLHLMRNAVNHALETPEVRIQKGKPPAGQIKLSASYDGNQVVITVRDDGVGIDAEHVRHAAISRGLIRADQSLSQSDLIDLIFRPGFSTAAVLSEESGRGVGLDVVRDSVSRLRGTLEVESMPGQGTAFTMKFPTSLAIQNAMMARVGGQQFAIPTVNVESIGRLDNFKRGSLGGQVTILVQNEHYPLRMLAQYLSLPIGSLDEKAQLLIVNVSGQRVALVVDEIKGRYDIVMKSLGPHLRQVHGIAGGTVLGNGQVVLVLELSDLLSGGAKLVANVAGSAQMLTRQESIAASVPQTPVRQSVDLSGNRQSIAPVRPGAAAVPERGKHILVVDDSPSVRRVVSTMLKSNGWEVQMARDGVEALEMISYETPAAVLLDIEMPRMDGYELIATVRAQEQYRTLPLVVLTSRAAAKHQQRAMQLGASAYVVKPYQDEELLGTLRSLVYGAAVR